MNEVVPVGGSDRGGPITWHGRMTGENSTWTSQCWQRDAVVEDKVVQSCIVFGSNPNNIFHHCKKMFDATQ